MSEIPTTDDDLTGAPSATPPGEHSSELTGDIEETDASDLSDEQSANAQQENAQTSQDQPSQ